MAEPAWKQNLRPASFRGVSFGVMDTSSSGGRRTVLHEYPGRDAPFIEDLGKKGRAYNLQGFVVGSDYMALRDRLISALETKGAGKLVHPYLGEMTVQPGECSWSETRDDGGMAVFQLQFYSTSDPLYPTSSANVNAAVSAGTSAVASASVVAAQAAVSSIVGLKPAQAQATAGDVASKIDEEIRPAVSRLTTTLPQYAAQQKDFARNIASIAVSAQDMVIGYQQMIAHLAISSDLFLSLSVCRRVFDRLRAYFLGKHYGASRDQVALRAYDSAVQQAAGFAAVATGADCAIAATYTTRRQAEDARNSIDAMIEGLIYWVTDDDLFKAADDLRSAVAAAIPPEGVTLKDEVTVQLSAPVPSLALAWSVYGGVALESDIVARNDVRNPFAVPAGAVVVLK